MNELNYTSLDMSRKLVKAGIVLKTEAKWIIWPTGLAELVYSWQYRDADVEVFPAPSFTELWRELPAFVGLTKQPDGISKCWVESLTGDMMIKVFFNANPADALAELLIFVKGRDVRCLE